MRAANALEVRTQVLPYVWDLPLERRLILTLTFGGSHMQHKSGVRRDLLLDGRAQEVEVRVPPSARTAALGGGVSNALVRVEPVDCQRLIVRCLEVKSPSAVPWRGRFHRVPAKVYPGARGGAATPARRGESMSRGLLDSAQRALKLFCMQML